MLTFGEAFARILKQRQMSVSAAAAELGFSSKTALFRIINDESKPSSIRKCLDAAIACRALALTEQEIAALETALKVSAVGKHAYMIVSALDSVLHPETNISEDTNLCGNTPCTTMSGFLRHLSLEGYESIRIGVFGSCPEKVFAMLSGFISQAPVTNVFHVFLLDENRPEDLQVFGKASSILFCPQYKPHIFTNPQDACSWIFKSGCIILTCYDHHGSRTDYQMLPFVGDSYHVSKDQSGKLADFWLQIISSMPDSFVPVKMDAQNMSVSFPDSYIDFTKFYERLEHNRELYIIRPDLPFFCISPDVLRPIITEGFVRSGMGSEAEPLVAELYAIAKKRFDNLFNKKKDTHIVLSRTAMRRFAKTGVRSDHFFASRPYTPQERVEIMQNILDQMKNNPHFNIWFSKDPTYIVDKEVTAYDGFGLAIVKGDTTWELDKDHQEILLENKLLASSFKEYMLADILPGEVLSRTRSISLMEQLIALAARSA